MTNRTSIPKRSNQAPIKENKDRLQWLRYKNLDLYSIGTSLAGGYFLVQAALYVLAGSAYTSPPDDLR